MLLQDLVEEAVEKGIVELRQLVSDTFALWVKNNQVNEYSVMSGLLPVILTLMNTDEG